MSQTNPKHAAETVRRLKRQTTAQERLNGWQQTRAAQTLGGEFALNAKLGCPGYSEEQAEMVAALFGR